MVIAVVGTGYVGLVSAACFAELGHTVWGIDIDEAKVAMLKSGKSPIFEPGLEEIIQRNLENGRLVFTTDLTEALPHVSIVFSAVATPPGEGFKADLRAVFAVAETVATKTEKSVLFVNKSTVPVGTGEKCEGRINKILQERGKDFAIPVISNPEFLREGMAVGDTLQPDRVVIGINDDETNRQSLTANRSLMEELYAPITDAGSPLVFMSRESAEIVKYAANAFLATKISFINMLTELCEKTDADIRDVAKGIGLDNRIGAKFLNAGIGYGGSCFPKDVKALMATAEEYGVPMPIVHATDEVNDHQRKRFIDLVLSKLSPASTVAVWGLAFKPETDDMREAPSIDIIHALINAGHTVKAFDPAAVERAKPLLPSGVTYVEAPLDAVTDAHALLLLTEWSVFKSFNMMDIKAPMKGNLLFDGRNIFSVTEATNAGFTYYGIGVPTV